LGGDPYEKPEHHGEIVFEIGNVDEAVNENDEERE
jgi:hypothetical protein